MPDLIIRKYKPKDEQAIRRICFDTALYGRPIKKYIKNPILISETFLGYYIRFEPDNILIAEIDGQVAGYLSGCLNTKRYKKIFARRIFPRLIWIFIFQGYFLKINVWQAAYASVVPALKWNKTHKHLLDNYPAHFHIDIDSNFQGQGVGQQLVSQFIKKLEEKKVNGIHLDTATSGGQHFFIKMGFKVLSKEKMSSFFGLPSHELWIMGKKLLTK